MFKKTLISEFFTTINFDLYLKTLSFLSYKLPFIRYGANTNLLEEEFLSYLGLEKSKIISMYNGRSTIYHALKLAGIKKNNEVIITGYTCISVSNAVIQTGAKVVYSDISKKDLGLNLSDLEKRITSNTKVIIVQHTFGKASNIKKIISLAKKYNILIIEDCAHSLGTTINGIKTGSFGDFAIFSTGRDKVISSVTGGFLIINNPIFFTKIEKIKNKLIMPPRILTIKNLFYNIVAYKAYKTYDFLSLGKVIISLSNKLHLIPQILSKDEKGCNFNKFNYRLPNSLAYLATRELQNIKIYKAHRKVISEYYNESLNNKYIKTIFNELKNEKNNFFRYPILLKNEKIKRELYLYMRVNKVLLGNYWSGQNIVPLGVNNKLAQYREGTCLNAEDISSRILTLPNHRGITIDDASRVISLLNNFKSK